MKRMFLKIKTLAWQAALSPKTIVAFKVASLALQAFHEIENLRRARVGKKVGFQFPGDEE